MSDPTTTYTYPGPSEVPPVLTLNGTGGTITGVRFVWMDWCRWCRVSVHVPTDGGEIHAGIESTQSGKTVRWFERHTTKGHRPILPTECPHCGHDRPFFGNSFQRHTPRPRAEGWRLTDGIWDMLRRDHPDLVVRADKVRHLSDHRVNGHRSS